jgi:hypothetical protein
MRDLVLTVKQHEAEPEALLQTEDTRKQTVVAKKKKKKNTASSICDSTHA